MAYRTLEEKFLADFAELEAKNLQLTQELGALKAQLDESSKKTFVERKLQAMVITKGREDLFDSFTMYCAPDTYGGVRDFDEWCLAYIQDYKLPCDVSRRAVINFFENEFQAAWEQAYEEEVASKKAEEAKSGEA